jgi:hypothetical protein
MTTKELLETAYVMQNWDIRMTQQEVNKLLNDAKELADKFDNDQGGKE